MNQKTEKYGYSFLKIGLSENAFVNSIVFVLQDTTIKKYKYKKYRYKV